MSKHVQAKSECSHFAWLLRWLCCSALCQSGLSGLGQLVPTDKRDLQIIRMDITGVTRPEADNMSGAQPSPRAEALMAKSYAFRSEGFGDAGFSPVEGDEKTIGATVTMKVRF